MSQSSRIIELAIQQLDAYNQADLDAFCACYHPEVVVLDADGEVSALGLKAFRARYAAKFAKGGFGAEVTERLSVGDHCVDYERYWTLDASDVRVWGEVLVRYRLRDHLIGTVQFFH